MCHLKQMAWLKVDLQVFRNQAGLVLFVSSRVIVQLFDGTI